MNKEAVTARIEAACGQLGLGHEAARKIIAEVVTADAHPCPSTGGEPDQLHQQIGRLTAERDRLLKIQQEVAHLIGAKSPDLIIHDLRNLLNELMLLKALAGDKE